MFVEVIYFPSRSLRNPPIFRDATTGISVKWRLWRERRNSILMTRHYADLSSASNWLKQIPHVAGPIESTTNIWVVTRHQYEISAVVSQTSFHGETNGASRNVGCFLKLCWSQSNEEAFEHKLYVLWWTHGVYLLCVVDGETSIPGLAQTTRHCDVKTPGTRLGTEVLSSFRSVK